MCRYPQAKRVNNNEMYFETRGCTKCTSKNDSASQDVLTMHRNMTGK
jgi:hypothetical protein